MSEQKTSDPPIRRLREVAVYSNRFAAVYDDLVAFADGTEGRYLRIVESDGKPGVAILAVCEDQVALVQTYRYALAAFEWGVPRGFAHGNDAISSARAELAEELGEEPDELHSIGATTPNSGLLASRVELFLARYAKKVSKPTDRNEVVGVKWITFAALRDGIARGEITDAFTLSAITCASARGHIELG